MLVNFNRRNYTIPHFTFLYQLVPLGFTRNLKINIYRDHHVTSHALQKFYYYYFFKDLTRKISDRTQKALV